MRVTFHGVRGSTPCQSDDIRRYGGNTSCVSVDAPGEDPLLLDMGTGLRYFGKQVPMGRPAQPRELAPVYVMLASDEASYVSGAMVAVTGGKPII